MLPSAEYIYSYSYIVCSSLRNINKVLHLFLSVKCGHLKVNLKQTSLPAFHSPGLNPYLPSVFFLLETCSQHLNPRQNPQLSLSTCNTLPGFLKNIFYKALKSFPHSLTSGPTFHTRITSGVSQPPEPPPQSHPLPHSQLHFIKGEESQHQ